jgi:hypothetical protein
MTDLAQYLSADFLRIEKGGVASPHGSWLAGIFGKAANHLEKELQSYVRRLLGDCRLNYNADVRPAVNGARFEKLTMGKLIAVIEKIYELEPHITAQQVPGGLELSGFLRLVQNVNTAWVCTKHGGEIGEETLLAHMKTMHSLAIHLQAEK